MDEDEALAVLLLDGPKTSGKSRVKMDGWSYRLCTDMSNLRIGVRSICNVEKDIITVLF